MLRGQRPIGALRRKTDSNQGNMVFTIWVPVRSEVDSDSEQG
jgi:hypothetical protein